MASPDETAEPSTARRDAYALLVGMFWGPDGKTAVQVVPKTVQSFSFQAHSEVSPASPPEPETWPCDLLWPVKRVWKWGPAKISAEITTQFPSAGMMATRLIPAVHRVPG